MPMIQWEFRIVPWIAEGNVSATWLKMLVMRFVDVPSYLSLLEHFAAKYKSIVIIFIISITTYTLISVINQMA